MTERMMFYTYISGEKVQESIEIDKFVVDLSENENVIGVEIFNASDIISRLIDMKLSKEDLGQIKDASLSSIRSKELAFIKIALQMHVKDITIEKNIQVPMPITVYG